MKILRLTTLAVVLSACGGTSTPGSAFGDYEDENVTVFGSEEPESGGEERITVTDRTGRDAGCVEVSANLCVPVDANGDWCTNSDGPVDVIVIAGEVEEVICYASDDDGPQEVVDTTNEGDIDIVQNANNTAVTFDPGTDGEPIEGDLNIEGNNVSVYGNGPENTILDGDIVVSGNNARLRGVTVTGNLTVSLNNTAIVLVRVLGDFIVEGEGTNNSVFVENDIFGNVIDDGNNNLYSGNDVQSEWTLTGSNYACEANHAFEDTNEDELVGDGERGDALTCPQR